MTKRVRRVLMTADANGGVFTHAVELAEGLADFDVEVLLAMMGDPLSDSHREAVAALPNTTLVESTWRLEWMDDPWDDVCQSADWLVKLADEYSPDIVHLNSYSQAAWPFRVPVVVGAHSCVVSWWNAVHGEEPSAAWQRYREEVRIGVRAADIIISPTQAMLDEIKRYYGPLKSSCVVPNGCGHIGLSAEDKKSRVLSAGRFWDEAKNAGTLAAAGPQLLWPTYLAGPGADRFASDNVISLGCLSRTQLGDWLRSSSIYVAPALYEPFGLSILEAASAGCALVLGDIPSLRENWDGVAVFVPSRDHLALGNAINRLIEDEPERKRRQAAALARAQEFSTERMAEDYFASYQMLVQERCACAS